MKFIMNALRRFGGVGLLEDLPTRDEYEDYIERNEELLSEVNNRVEALEIEVANVGRLPNLNRLRERRGSNDHQYGELGRTC